MLLLSSFIYLQIYSWYNSSKFCQETGNTKVKAHPPLL
jgi:hypothetical protein